MEHFQLGREQGISYQMQSWINRGRGVRRSPQDTPQIRALRFQDTLLANNLERLHMLQTREQLFSLYEDMGNIAGPLNTMIYPAGSHDIFPILLAQKLVILDRAPLLSSQNPVSYRIDSALSKSPLSIGEMLAETSPLHVDIENKLIDAQILVPYLLTDRIPGGFEGRGKKPNSAEDNFSDMLASLMILGVDMQSVRMQKTRSNSYTIAFTLDGIKKQIVYITEILPEESSHLTDKEKQRVVYNALRGMKLPRRTGLLSKADQNRVAASFMIVKPDVLFLDKETSMLPEGRNYTYETILREQKYGGLAYGYNDYTHRGNLVLIGKLTQ